MNIWRASPIKQKVNKIISITFQWSFTSEYVEQISRAGTISNTSNRRQRKILSPVISARRIKSNFPSSIGALVQLKSEISRRRRILIESLMISSLVVLICFRKLRRLIERINNSTHYQFFALSFARAKNRNKKSEFQNRMEIYASTSRSISLDIRKQIVRRKQSDDSFEIPKMLMFDNFFFCPKTRNATRDRTTLKVCENFCAVALWRSLRIDFLPQRMCID